MHHPLYPPSAPESARRRRKLAPTQGHAMRTHGLFCVPSSGAHLVAAQRVREQNPQLKTVVTIFDDEGEKYPHDFFMHPAASDHAPVPFH